MFLTYSATQYAIGFAGLVVVLVILGIANLRNRNR